MLFEKILELYEKREPVDLVTLTELLERKNETLESLKNEGVFVESVFLDKQGEDLYLIYYMKAENIARVYEVYGKSELAIDHYHKECWKIYCERGVILETLLDIDRVEF